MWPAESGRETRNLTGDIGVVHPDSYVEPQDGAKDVIISGGKIQKHVLWDKAWAGLERRRHAQTFSRPSIGVAKTAPSTITCGVTTLPSDESRSG